MISLGLTGGIATGKSTAISYFRELDPKIVIFDADESVQQLWEIPAVIEIASEALGIDLFDPDGRLDRSALRSRVFDHPGDRKKLEGVLHPMVRKECLELREKSSKNDPSTLFVADVPLLFEGGFDFGQERNLVVATTETTQRCRLKSRSHFSDDLISSILAAQLPIMEKVALGDVVFWNEGSPAVLRRQVALFLLSLRET